MDIINESINTIRCLAMDAVQKANSGHPGTPMALAPAAYILWMNHLRFNPKDPTWFNRDRFVLSNGHASMLQYSLLYLCGYDVSLNDIKQFRQWESKTPGHPEYGLTPGIETTTGPLGQGFSNAVGMALAEAHLAAVFNKEEKLIDHFTYVFCSDGDLMEGISHESASFAGTLKLGKLICLFDDNNITIEGKATLSCTDDVIKRFESYHWHVQSVEDGNDLDAIDKAYTEAKKEIDRPSLIILKTHIGYGSPKQDTSAAHGSPLGIEDIKVTKAFYGFPEEEFFVSEQVKMHMNKEKQGTEIQQAWEEKVNKYKEKNPGLYGAFQSYISQEIKEDLTPFLPKYNHTDKPMATREVSRDFLNAVAGKVPWLMGGSGDLEPSTHTFIHSSDYLTSSSKSGRNIAFGIREHFMCGALNGMALHGGVKPYGATFFIFSDYARPAIRLASIMKIPVIFVMTHDSIGLGEDGTTHQPIEHLASFRAMPGMCLIRPADANEAAYAWKLATENKKGPIMLVLSRQKLPILDQNTFQSAKNLEKGAYILSKEKKDLEAIIIATGSEVHIALEAQSILFSEGIDVRVVSMPSWELFRAQPAVYKESVLPRTCPQRVAIEAGSTLGWCEWVGDSGIAIGLNHFGESAPYEELYKNFGLTSTALVKACKSIIQ